MQSNTTQQRVALLLKQSLVVCTLLLLFLGQGFAQTYINGNLSTGATSSSGATAPTGFTWSEVQAGNSNAGFGANVDGGFTLADDFTVPAGQTWTLTNVTFFAYSTGAPAATSPFDEVRFQIFSANPSTGAAPIFGDLTTNRFTSAVSANMYRIFNGAVNPPLNTRQIWAVTANVGTALTAGTYWIEWQLGTVAGVTSNFSPASTVVGTTTQPGNNAQQHNLATNAWTALLDGPTTTPPTPPTNPQDMPFVINYTSVTCTGTPPTVAITPATPGCGPATLTASGADTYVWSPAAGLNTTTGATVIASPTTTTVYTVTGTNTNNCSNTATVTVNAGSSAAVLGPLPPAILENFDAGIPANWVLINNSDQPANDWIQGNPTNFTAFNGADDSYASALWSSTDGSEINNWMITHPVQISNGDVFSFYTRTADPAATIFPDRLEVRMSSVAGAPNVGTSPTSVGDFTTLLVTVNPNLTTTGYPDTWTRFEVTISGLAAPVTGRFGFRYFVTDGGPAGNNSNVIGVDNVTLTTPTATGCVAPGTPQNMQVSITGGTGPYTVVYSDGTTNTTVNNYASGDEITITPAGSATYSLVSVTDANGCTGANLSGTFVVTSLPTITTQPATTTSLCAGSPATISVVAPGAGLTYQWQVSTDGGTTFTDITDGTVYTGATTATLNILNGDASMNGYNYQVIVNNGCPTGLTSDMSTLEVAASPTINTQPVDVTTCDGSAANFLVGANGTGFTYEWFVSTDNGTTYTAIPGATTNGLDIPAVSAAMNGYLYYVLVGGCSTPISSDTVMLTVSNVITITTQPTDVTECSGNTATFSVVANGSNNTYQWQVSTDGGTTFTDITGANSDTYTTDVITPAMANNQYQVIATNTCGNSATSNPATLNVTLAATITTDPVSQTACSGSDVTFDVTATGATSYQWQVSTDGGTTFTDIAGETNPSLTVNAGTTGANDNQYQVIVGSCPTPLTSAIATLTVNDPVAITAQPVSVSACDGSDATFTVTADGTDNTYQWQVSTDGGTTFTDIAGETNASLTIPAVSAPLNNNQYQVLISNTCTPLVTSTPASLTIAATTAITTQPTATSGCDAGDAAFSVIADGATGYQWQVSTDGGTSFTDITGETNATLNLTGITSGMNNNQYQVIVTGCGGSTITSDAATLTITPQADITTQPSSVTGCIGSDATFSVVVNGTGLTYQWEVSTDGGTTFTQIPGANTDQLTVTGIDATMNGNQYIVVVNGTCTVNLDSDAATLNISTGTTITTQPSDNQGCIDAGADFTVVATDATSYQWQVSTDGGTTFTDIAGATSATLTVSALTSGMNNNQYQVIATGPCGTATSNPATLTVNDNPTVGVDGPAAAVCAGSSITLMGTGADTYTWDNGVTNNTPFTINGTTTYTVTGTTTATGCSNTATITVTVNDAPTVTITADQTELEAGESAIITATAGFASYQWMRGITVVAGATTNTLTVNAADADEYSVMVTDANGCTGTSNTIEIEEVPSNFAFITPNPSNGQFRINYLNAGTSAPARVVNVFDAKGTLVYKKSFPVTLTNTMEVMEVDMQKMPSGVYWVLLSDSRGQRLKTAKIYISK